MSKIPDFEVGDYYTSDELPEGLPLDNYERVYQIVKIKGSLYYSKVMKNVSTGDYKDVKEGGIFPWFHWSGNAWVVKQRLLVIEEW